MVAALLLHVRTIAVVVDHVTATMVNHTMRASTEECVQRLQASYNNSVYPFSLLRQTRK
jgi:hypothetical protein